MLGDVPRESHVLGDAIGGCTGESYVLGGTRGMYGGVTQSLMSV